MIHDPLYLCKDGYDVIEYFQNIPPFFDEPKAYNLTSRLFDPGFLETVEADIDENNIGSAGGTSLSQERALTKLFGEACERYALIMRHDSELFCPYSEIDRQRSAINPNTIRAGTKDHSSDVSNQPFFWVSARSLRDGSRCLIPKQLVDVPYFHTKEEPIIRIGMTTGAACGSSEADARLRAALEVIERDAFMLSWLTHCGSRHVVFDASTISPRESDLLRRTMYEVDRYDLEAVYIDLFPDKDIHVYATVLFDHSGIGPYCSVGAKAALSQYDAVLGALEEAIQLRHWLRALKYTEAKSTSDNWMPNDLDVRGRLIMEEAYKPHIHGWIDAADRVELPLPIKDDAGNDIAHHMNLVLQHIEGEIWAVELSDRLPERVQRLPLFVSKVVAPDMQPLYLTEELQDICWNRVARRREDRWINPIPHPFL